MSTADWKNSSKRIREKVDDRHWQLFECRMKNFSTETNRTNYTKSNDYRIIDRFKKPDQPQLPIEPNQRWQSFCSQLTTKSNENTRLMSIFHNVWIKNWNTVHERQHSNEKNFLEDLSSNEHDKKIISSILHQN